jgi:hypothetical protein
MDRFSKFAEGLAPEEIVQLRSFIKQGDAVKMLNHFLDVLGGSKVCPTCESPVDETKDILIHFGPEGLRQKASFCGYDCLEYFLLERKMNAQTLNTERDDEVPHGPK